MSETYQGSQLECENGQAEMQTDACRFYTYPEIEGRVYRESPVTSYMCCDTGVESSTEEKKTLQYINANYENLVNFLVRNKRLDSDTARGIVSDTYIEFERKPDFEFQVSERGEVISLGTYIRYMMKQMVKRRFSKNKKIYDNECSNIHYSNTGDDSEEDYYNTIADEKSSISIDIDIDSILKSCRALRYSCGGADIFEFLYIMVIYALGDNKNTSKQNVYSKYKILLKARGMSESDASTIEQKMRKSDNIIELIKQFTVAEQDEKLDDIEKGLRKYVYGVKQIREILALA